MKINLCLRFTSFLAFPGGSKENVIMGWLKAIQTNDVIKKNVLKKRFYCVFELVKFSWNLFFKYNLLCVSGEIVCKQMNSSWSLWKKRRGWLVIVASTQNSGFQQTFYADLKRALFISRYRPTSGQAKSFLSPFNPSLYFGKTQNQVPCSALVVKSERAVFFPPSWALNRSGKLVLLNRWRRKNV